MNSQVPERRVEELSNLDLYDAWSSTYDTDGNILQALDTFGLDSVMLPRLLKAVTDQLPSKEDGEDEWRFTDMGCGTGRADLRLIAALQSSQNEYLVASIAAKRYNTITLTGLDVSSGMLRIARDRVPASRSVSSSLVINTEFEIYDIFDEHSQSPPAAHAVISTLVMEHTPLELYFSRAATLLRPGGLFLATNMHPDMGNATFASKLVSSTQERKDPRSEVATRAGFIDPRANIKYRGTSYAHTIDEVRMAARAVGFILVGPVEEKRVERRVLEAQHGKPALLGERGRKWIGINCWFGMIFQLEDRQH